MDNYCLNEFFNNVSETIRIYLGTETIQDPYERNVSETLLNPIPIKAIVTDLTFAKVQWAMPGIVTDKAKEIIIQKRYESLLLKSRKIKIGTEYYNGWKVNEKLQYRVEGNYIRAYVYIKKS
jgi:hypothetical protein